MGRRAYRWTTGLVLAAAASVAGIPGASRAQAPRSELEELRREIRRLRESERENRRRLEDLERRLRRDEGAESATTPQRALDEAVQALPAPAAPAPAPPAPPAAMPTGLWSRPLGGLASVRLADVGLDVMVTGGGSSADDAQIAVLQGGAHDPKRRGFTLQQAELSLAGAVDPYFTAYAFMLFGTDVVELEEAYFVSLALPYSLQLKGGYYLTEFGLINPTHPHAWDWIDQPVVNTRMFGGDGLRSPGLRLGWIAPVPWYAEIDVGAQAPNDGLVTSFISIPAIGGRPAVAREVSHVQDLLYFARLGNAFALTDDMMLMPGFSFLSGPNSTGNRGQTFIFGTDIKLRWRPARNFRGWPFFIWQTEAMNRAYTADWFIAGTELGGGDDGHDHGHSHSRAPGPRHAGGHGHGHGDSAQTFPNNLPGGILRDWGLYTQVLYGFRHPWAAGLRFEYADGSGDSVEDGELVSSHATPYRGLRYRISPLLVWQPTEFSRFRLQYNWDYTPWLPGGHTANSVWLSAEVMIGAHPAHKY